MGKIEQILLLLNFKILIFLKRALHLSDRLLGRSYICLQFFLGQITSKKCHYVHEKLQRKPSIERGLKFFMDLKIWDF